MIVGVPTETFPGERRIATIPAVVPALAKSGLDVLIEAGAGESAGFTDAAFTDKGAQIAAGRARLFADADVILQVRTLGANPVNGRADLELLRPGQTVIGFSEPLGEPQSARDLAARGATAFSMELIPRITRAQSMDALSSMATIAGYKSVLLAAEMLPRMFPMMMTAAGTITPARVFIVGAGVAGLQAIASARRLGAKVEAYDVRPAVKEQVESLGATFVDLPLDTDESEDMGGYAKAQDEAFYARQREMMARVVSASDVVVTTALIPGRPAPTLVTDEMVASMMPGSVIVDLAAERGGNVEPSRPDETVVAHGVTVLGPTNLPATVPFHASQMYAKNVSALLLHLVDDGALRIDLEDEITQGTLVSKDGEVVHPRVRELLDSPA
ncbi:MAG: Re/Si-specific NAD(P)(+) transhydrogenase subunit alpha [Vicinamibacterales bacterium]|jgi:NAD(P) transhydrogenase subunit alpha|nr:Re/Si-specific NAD(P)(+) transhydrogenase subunit alpha [Vicinamibacterales bacterium]